MIAINISGEGKASNEVDQVQDVADDMIELALEFSDKNLTSEVFESFEQTSSLISFLGEEILYPEDDEESTDKSIQYRATLKKIHDQILPEINSTLKAPMAIKSRSLLNNLREILMKEETKIMATFLIGGVARMQTSGLPGVAALILPFLQTIKQIRNVRMRNRMRSADRTADNLLNTGRSLNEATGGAIRPITDLSVALSGLNQASDMVFDESKKVPKSLLDYFVNAFIVGNGDNRILSITKNVCRANNYVESIMEEAEKADKGINASGNEQSGQQSGQLATQT